MRDLQHGKTDIASIALSRIYIYIHGTNKFLVKNDGIRGRSFVLSLEYIERQGGIFFLKPPKNRNICLSAVARSSCRWMYACYCLVYTRVRAHTTNGAQHLAPCFLIKVAPPVSLSLSLSLRSLNRSCSSSSMKHFVKKYKTFTWFVARPFFLFFKIFKQLEDMHRVIVSVASNCLGTILKYPYIGY